MYIKDFAQCLLPFFFNGTLKNNDQVHRKNNAVKGGEIFESSSKQKQDQAGSQFIVSCHPGMCVFFSVKLWSSGHPKFFRLKKEWEGGNLQSTEGLLEVVGEGTLLVQVLDVAAIGLETASSTLGDVVLAGELGEAPLLGDDDLLATGELELGTTKGLDDDSLVGVLGTDREDDLADIDTGSGTVGLTVGTTHTGLKTISTGTGQHLVDTENVEGVETDTHVEGILSGGLGDILVSANATSLEGLGRDLLLLVAEQVDAEGELVNTGLLTTQIVDADLGV
jgi:hypothetical protein